MGWRGSNVGCWPLVVMCGLLIALAPVQSIRQPSGAGFLGGAEYDNRDHGDPCEATEVHLSLTDDYSAVQVAWRTRGTSCESAVRYGFLNLGTMHSVNDTSTGRSGDQNGLPLQALNDARGTSYTVTESAMCAAPAAKQKFEVNMHVVLLPDLVADTDYWYQPMGSSRSFTFHSPIPTGSRRQSRQYSFIAVGDMGQASVKAKKTRMSAATISTMLREMKEQPVDLVLHIGDLAYADGNARKWDAFMEQIEPVASRVPYMVGVGNHEGVKELYRPAWGNYGTENGGECGVMMSRRFPLAGISNDRHNAPFWYSFDYGDTHFTFISTEHDLSPGSEQYSWLARDLSAVDRCVTPWVVLGLHRPLMVGYPHKDNRVVGDHLRDFIEELLLEYKVDITIAGHVHTYYRTCRARAERCTDDGSGITHFVVGTGGHVLSDLEDDQKPWLTGSLNDYGFLRFDVDDDVMHARFILSATGEVADEVRVPAHVYTRDECEAMRAHQLVTRAALEARLAQLHASTRVA